MGELDILEIPTRICFFVPESIVMVDGCCPDLFGTPHFT